MGGVYCPSCEAGVEPASKFCLSCGNDLTVRGPITATGHDLNQLKDVIRTREDLSMAEKFDMIAKVEDGANPILLGIAAPADGDEVDIAESVDAGEAGEEETSVFQNYEFGESAAAAAAVRATVRGTDGWVLVQKGTLDLSEGLFRDAMNLGMDASTHIHDVSSGEHEGIDPEAMRSIPVLKPPKRSFCPKCGSDIHANTMLQWRKWRDSSGDVVSMQLEASMETALIQVASHYLTVIENMKKDASSVDEEALLKKLEKQVRKEMEAEFEGRSVATKSDDKKKSTASKSSTASKPKKSNATTPKKKSGGLFGGAKRPKKTFEGKAGDKADWFLAEALDTIYDPHGTGKVLKPKTILARSSDGNVRVQDVVRVYDAEGNDGISDLAWTSPLTQYIIEAYDAC
ncbi:MAG: zinc ribbon domain-containing protein [Candidatus Poseidoniaceae archaeon]|nr:zinc ribbon domain-containing protein [Candidatus Poseidoniaceae archaeon]